MRTAPFVAGTVVSNTLVAAACLATFFVALRAADPATAVYWNAGQLKDLDKKAAGKLNPALHLGSERLLDSAFVLYRDGPSMAEIHTKLADVIVARDGEGAVLVGGKIVGGAPSGQDEIRGESIDGGMKYTMKPGDELYVPANTPHQFLVDKGKTFTATIIKITPKP
jgi:uncharacterized protein YfaQ (DUF2300 family)